MPTVWRLTKTKYLATAWDGEGARLNGGRWNSVGCAVVYACSSLSLALLETLVHLPAAPLQAYTAVSAELDDSLVAVLEDKDLPADWMALQPPVSTQAIGNSWILAARSAALRVKSVVVPTEFNYLLNPRHPDFARVPIGKALAFPLDPRIPLPPRTRRRGTAP